MGGVPVEDGHLLVVPVAVVARMRLRYEVRRLEAAVVVDEDTGREKVLGKHRTTRSCEAKARLELVARRPWRGWGFRRVAAPTPATLATHVPLAFATPAALCCQRVAGLHEQRALFFRSGLAAEERLLCRWRAIGRAARAHRVALLADGEPSTRFGARSSSIASPIGGASGCCGVCCCHCCGCHCCCCFCCCCASQVRSRSSQQPAA